jgi:hypothetical protein
MTTNLTLFAISTATPTYGVWRPASLTITQFLVMVVFLLALRLSAAMTEDLEKALCQAVVDALLRSRLTVEQAAGIMEWNVHNFRHALRGDPRHQLSLNKLVKLPFSFWMWMLPDLAFLVARQNIRHIGEDLGLTRSA